MSLHESLLHHHAVVAERAVLADRRGRLAAESLGGVPVRRRGASMRARLAAVLVVLSGALANAAERIETPAPRTRLETRL